MAFGLWVLIKACVLCVNAVAILNEPRFLKPCESGVVWCHAGLLAWLAQARVSCGHPLLAWTVLTTV